MVQKASLNPKRLGRQPDFDRDAVIAAAVDAFWQKGFAATTLSDLEAATGIDRSTIYNSFGGKDGLYHSATAAYVDRSTEVLFDVLHTGTRGLADIIEFLDRLAVMFGNDNQPNGCLIVNAMAGHADHDATKRYLENLEDGLHAALERASAAGQIDPDNTVHRQQILTTAILGVNIVHRNDTSGTKPQTLLSGLRSEVASWADPTEGLRN
jgi:TetR/AcrR family transcriptional repressor of nem operon